MHIDDVAGKIAYLCVLGERALGKQSMPGSSNLVQGVCGCVDKEAQDMDADRGLLYGNCVQVWPCSGRSYGKDSLSRIQLSTHP